MDLISRVSQHFTDSAQLKIKAKDVLAGPLVDAAERMVQCLMKEGKILSCGNGGSAADAHGSLRAG
jgi:D-sedoheptulose 7-phosphate isomerase